MAALTKAEMELIWREKEREDAKIRAIELKGREDSPITEAALRRHRLIRDALIHYYRCCGLYWR